MKIVFLGLSISSSWGNGHATTYRGLLRELNARGHDVVFLERDRPWYAENRDLPAPTYCSLELYSSVPDLQARFTRCIGEADCLILGSYVPDGVEIGEWVTRVARGVTAFYDIDTPVTLAKLAEGDYEYLAPHLIPRFQRYLSFTGGPTLRFIEDEYESPSAHALYCSADPELYHPQPDARPKWALGYLGTYSDDRQPTLDRLLLQPAAALRGERFMVAGPLYPETLAWPENVERISHLEPRVHGDFYNSQRYTLNVTRAAMVRAGYSPSVRLFEAAACGTPIISDEWPGLDSLFEIGTEILVAASDEQVVAILQQLPEEERRAIGRRARRRVLAEHTAAHRAAELEAILENAARPWARALQATFS